MLIRIILSVLAISSISSCSNINTEQHRVISQIYKIDAFPVSRTTLVNALELESIPSNRVSGGVRGGRIWYLETWTLPNGSKVTAWDSEYVGDVPITRRSIDENLNNPDRTRIQKEPRDFVVPFPKPPARLQFDRLTVSNARQRVIFDSTAAEIKKTNKAEMATPRKPSD